MFAILHVMIVFPLVKSYLVVLCISCALPIPFYHPEVASFVHTFPPCRRRSGHERFHRRLQLLPPNPERCDVRTAVLNMVTLFFLWDMCFLFVSCHFFTKYKLIQQSIAKIVPWPHFCKFFCDVVVAFVRHGPAPPIFFAFGLIHRLFGFPF